MLAKNSYLFISGIFLIFGIYSYHTGLATSLILFWASITFLFFWFLHFLKINLSQDYAPLLVRDSLFKQCLFGVVLFPFHVIKYLSLVMQSFSKEQPISQVTDKMFIGQQLLWFHQKEFKERNISAVLDITIENTEPFFITTDKSINYLRIPVLDKTSPTVRQLEDGVKWGLDQIAQGKKLYVHCTAGHERSATFVAAMLLRSKECKDLDEAMNKIRANRPKARFVTNQREIIVKWFKV